MKVDMDTLSCASVDSLFTKIKNLPSRPIVEFNKYDVLDLLEALKDTTRVTYVVKKRGTLGWLMKP